MDSYNVNDNENVSTRNHNVNDNGNRYDRSRNVDRIAKQLVDKFGNSEYYEFYCKIAYKLSESQIWNFCEQANGKKVRNPARMFSWLCKRALND